jgi:electron transfer flavoprotein alpha subunit
MPGFWIVAETYPLSLELLSLARQTAPHLSGGVTLLLAGGHEHTQEAIDSGADRITLLPALPTEASLDAYLPLLETEARRDAPDLILMAATARGKDLGARLAARLETGLCSNCTAVTWNGQENCLEMERLAYGGAAVQTVRCRTRPAMAAVVPGVAEPAPPLGKGLSGEIRELPSPPPGAVRVIERRARERTTRNIAEAKVVVSVGRGLAKAEDLGLIRELAHALSGEIGGTRPVTEELRWLPEEVCIGLSGVQVKPDLFLALGVSGQIQHVTGIRGAKVIAAVNRDENAPIFAVADYGIVGDLYEVVPKLLKALKA